MVAPAIAAGAIGAMLPTLFGTMKRSMDQHVNRICPNEIPQPEDIIAAYTRGAISSDQMKRGLKSLGFGDTAIDAMLEAAKPLLSPADLVKARNKGVINEAEYKNGLSKLGFNESDAEALYFGSQTVANPEMALKLKRLGKIDNDEYLGMLKANGLDQQTIDQWESINQYIPPPQDLVRFGVREAFSPELAAKLGLYQDIPPAFIEACKAQGMTEEDASKYWAAHWQLPSLGEGFDMYHRGILTEDELKQLMRAQDYSPVWRDKLEQLSYNPYTRIDGSRMFLTDQISADELYKNYRNLGYDDEHARNLVEYYTKQKEAKALAEAEKKAKKASTAKSTGSGKSGGSGVRASDRDISIGLIKSAYFYNEITQEDALNLLGGINFEPWEAALTIDVWDAELKKKDMQDKINLANTKYQRGLLSKDEYRDELAKLNIPTVTMEILVLKNTEERMAKVKKASLNQIKSWFKKKIISEEEMIEYMGYLNLEERAGVYFLRELGFQ